MKSTREYLKLLLANCRLDRWNLVSVRKGTADDQREKLKGTLEFFGAMDSFATLEEKLLSAPDESPLSDDIQELAVQLKEDLIDYIAPDLHQEYYKTEIAFLPLPSVDGFCVNKDYKGRQLDGYIVCINEGLWISAQLLGKAFVLENMQGDLVAYKASGRPTYELAVKHYLSPAGKYAQQVFFENVPPSIEGEASAAQSSIAILILQFVALHEIGHIANADFELMGQYRFHVANAENKAVSNTTEFWEAEYCADLFSLQAICRRSREDINRWANFVTIYVFFSWLGAIERRLGRPICLLHPPPANRAQRLETWMTTNYPPTAESDAYMQKTKRIVESWGN